MHNKTPRRKAGGLVSACDSWWAPISDWAWRSQWLAAVCGAESHYAQAETVSLRGTFEGTLILPR